MPAPRTPSRADDRAAARAARAEAVRAEAARAKRRRTLLWLAAAGAVVLLALAAALGASRPNSAEDPTRGAQAGASPSAEPQSPSDLARRQPGDPAAKGAVDAPVVVIEYADFRCKYCALFAQDTLPALLKDYVDTGKVRFEWRDAPVLGETSLDAAVAGRAAAQQGKFWEFYGAAYDVTIDGKPDWTREKLLATAAAIPGLDRAAFEKALDDPRLRAAVDAEASDSQSVGVTSTPTFVVGDQVVSGAQPLDVFRQLIDAELAAAL